jgi:hypothetical protein
MHYFNVLHLISVTDRPMSLATAEPDETRGEQCLEDITKVVSAPLSHTPGSRLYLARYAAKCTAKQW